MDGLTAWDVVPVDNHLNNIITKGILNKEYLKRCTCHEWIDYMMYMELFILDHKTAIKHMVITMRYCPYCNTGLS